MLVQGCLSHSMYSVVRVDAHGATCLLHFGMHTAQRAAKNNTHQDLALVPDHPRQQVPQQVPQQQVLQQRQDQLHFPSMGSAGIRQSDRWPPWVRLPQVVGRTAAVRVSECS